jgi:hypothetical protein
MADHLRDMHFAPGGKRIGGINYVGWRAEDLPSVNSQGFASLLRNDVALPADAGKRVRMEVLTHNVPGQATLWINEDGSGYLLNAPSGTWGGTYRLWVDGIASTADSYGLGAGIAPFSILVGTPCTLSGDAPFVITWGASGQVVGWAVPSCTISGNGSWLLSFSAAGAVQAHVANSPVFALPVERTAFAGRFMPTKVRPLDVAGAEDIAFDFSRQLRPGEQLDAGTVSITAEVRYASTVGAADPGAGALFVAEPGVLGGFVVQRVQGRVAGLTYLLRCEVRTAPTGRKLVCPMLLPMRRMA